MGLILKKLTFVGMKKSQKDIRATFAMIYIHKCIMPNSARVNTYWNLVVGRSVIGLKVGIGKSALDEIKWLFFSIASSIAMLAWWSLKEKSRKKERGGLQDI